MTFAEGEVIEKARRGLYHRRFRGHATRYNCDRYLPAAWQPEPRFGRVTEAVHEARMIGDGWHHAAAIAAAFLHDAVTSALFDGVDSQLRRCARSGLDLLMYMWGMRGSHPAAWTCDHLLGVLARRTGPGRSSCGSRIYPMEMFLLRFVEMRSLMNSAELGRPTWNFQLEHSPSADDPFSPHALHHQPLDQDDVELFRGDLVDPRRCQAALGKRREPCWVLLRAGVVMRSHVCDAIGSRFMKFEEAAQCIPDLAPTQGSRAEAAAAWARLVSELTALGVAPVPREPTASAFSIWRGGQSRGDGSDGVVEPGDREALDELLARLSAGDAAAASEWAEAYRALANGRGPRASTARHMPAPSVAERTGPHTRYYMPGKGGTRVETVCGRPPPVPAACDREQLERYRRQMWRIADDGQSIACLLGSTLGTASVIVQLFARSLDVALRAHSVWLEKKQRARRAQMERHERQFKDGPPPPPPPPTEEELSWDGGPGFNVALANRTMHELLDVERQQGFPFTAAAVGDGSWQPRDGTVSRAALLHSGIVVGGALATDDLVGGTRNNYDGEMVHRIDVLATLHRSRLLYIFDSTSPVAAGERFRRVTTATRAKMECDKWLGSTMGFEQRQEVIVYWWSKSHRGHLPEAAADFLANGFLEQDPPTPVPHTPSRHASARGYAKSSERELMLAASNLHFVREHFSRGEAIRATADDVDALRHAKLSELHGLRVLRLRDDHARLMRSRAFPSSQPRSVGARLCDTICPCGGGVQDRRHLLWHCQLPRVAAIRRERLLPACRLFRDRLDVCEPVSGAHAVAHACCIALEQQKAPRSVGAMAMGISGVVLTDDATAVAAERHLLGVVVQPETTLGLSRALRGSKAMLIAVADMLQACERASESVVRRVFGEHRRHQVMRVGLGAIRLEASLSRRCLATQREVPVATVRRCTPRIKASVVGPTVPAAMVASPWQVSGAVVRDALHSAEHATRVPRLLQQMRRIASAAVDRAVDDVAVAQICAEALLTVGEVRHMQRLPTPPPLHPAVAAAPPPLASLQILERRRKRAAREVAPSLSGGGDTLFWERRLRAFESASAGRAAAHCARQAAAAHAYVAWFEADYAARVAAAVRARRRRARVAAQVAAVRARHTPLTREARHSAAVRSEARRVEAAAVRRHLAYPEAPVSAVSVRERAAAVAAAAARAVADAAAAAAARALSLVVSVRRVTPRGVPVRGVLVGGGVSVGAHGEGDVTLSSAEVIPEL